MEIIRKIAPENLVIFDKGDIIGLINWALLATAS
jgi:hypothetical protein